ncbi:Elicitin [Phytophthora megakarya]|uniref:Elicitin n=1 Tax=Phytophthora megakarya TaxID=4795 RepID=A0A225VIZ9_9STRA|nr:Elicitin [Phytophthora megakarya]
MWDLYVSTATSDECADDSTVNGYSVYIFTSCDSGCADKIKDLATALPNCYYDYEFMNKKQDVLEELDDCEVTSTYISVTVYPDSSIEFTSSSGSSTSATNPPESGDLSDTNLDSSVAGTAESKALRETIQVWTIAIILAVTIVAF